MTPRFTGWLQQRFDLERRGTTIGTEVRAGTVTFLTMAYILFVNAQILRDAGMPAGDVVLATALASALATLVMGWWADYPFALAPGMGLNAYFAYTVVGGMGIGWADALGAVFVGGLAFLLLSVTGARRALLDAIPVTIKVATMSGIGLFLAAIGLQSAGIVVDHPTTLVTLGDPTTPSTLLALGGLLMMTVLMARRVIGALLVGILAVTAAAWGLGLAPVPQRWLEVPRLPEETIFALSFTDLASGSMITVVLAFLFVDLFDTAGTLIGVGRLGGFTDEAGNLERADRAFLADALGTTAGALLGTSPVTTYIESATGIEEGGRSGLTALTTGGLFLLAVPLTPLFTAVPAIATAPALILVGTLMMRGAAELPWSRLDEAVPAFLTMAAMPFTFSIANGISLGIVSWVLIQVLTGRGRQISPLLIGLTLALVGLYGFLL